MCRSSPRRGSARDEAGVAGGEGVGAADRGVADGRLRAGGDAQAQAGEALVVDAGEQIEEQADADGVAVGGGVEGAAERGAGGVGALAEQRAGAGEGVAAGEVGAGGGDAQPCVGLVGGGGGVGPGEDDAGREELTALLGWCGSEGASLGDPALEVTQRLGWLHTARVSLAVDAYDVGTPWVRGVLGALLRLPSARFLRHLTVGALGHRFTEGTRYETLLPLFEDGGPRDALRTLFLGDVEREEHKEAPKSDTDHDHD